MSSAADQINILQGMYAEGETSFSYLGFVCFWNLRNVDITQTQFAEMLKACNIDPKFAKEHNYRSAFIRAIRNMEEKRIIRRVEETGHLLVYQFTAESKEGIGKEASLNYDKETQVVIDKDMYRETTDFEAALTAGREDIRKKVIEHFHEEKVRYHSADVTRYIQRILEDSADVCSLREQGCVYFVPAAYQNIVNSVKSLVESLGSDSSFGFFPVPNVLPSQQLIGDAVSKEIEQLFKSLEKEIDSVANGDKDAGEKWASTKRSKIATIRRRINAYSGVLGDRAGKYDTDFVELLDAIRPSRQLDLGGDEEDEGEAKSA